MMNTARPAAAVLTLTPRELEGLVAALLRTCVCLEATGGRLGTHCCTRGRNSAGRFSLIRHVTHSMRTLLSHTMLCAHLQTQRFRPARHWRR